jgi:hypothetical protein
VWQQPVGKSIGGSALNFIDGTLRLMKIDLPAVIAAALKNPGGRQTKRQIILLQCNELFS